MRVIWIGRPEKTLRQTIFTSHSGLVLPSLSLDQSLILPYAACSLSSTLISIWQGNGTQEEQSAFDLHDWVKIWRERAPRCRWKRHACSSAVIAGRLGLLRKKDADNRCPHKKQECWTYSSLSPTEEAKWDNILYHMAAIDHSSRKNPASPINPSHQRERQLHPPQLTCSPLATWGRHWHCLFTS